MKVFRRAPRWLAVLAVLCGVAAPPAAAAETDPYYAWWAPPRDGTAQLNRAINAALDAGLDDVNRRGDRAQLRCAEVATQVTARLGPTAGWYALGLVRTWRVPVSPASSTEYAARFRARSVYRDATLWPAGWLMPLDPAVRVGDVVFGTDKIAHFFTNGARYAEFYQAQRGAGVDEETAERAALESGIAEERGWLGMATSGIFSYADLHANDAGLRFYRGLCEGPTPGLWLENGHWHRKPFDLAQHVDPCWDEGFAPSAFVARDEPAVLRALASLCERYDDEAIQQRRAAYLRRGCHGRSVDRLRALLAQGALPDPSATDIERVCRGARTAASPSAVKP